MPSSRDLLQASRRYRLTRLIRQGGMAEVWEGYLMSADAFARRVAIKRPLSRLTPELRTTLVDEAQILSRLSHPSILAVLDYGHAGGRPFLALEYVDGLDLQAITERSREVGLEMPRDVALLIAAEVAEALHAAHEATDENTRPLGIIHRDVSPQNVLLSWRGEVKLADFGIALAGCRQGATRSGLIKGKLAFMAPEQLHGDRLTRRTDIFSLGCVLHYLLRGASPFAGMDARVRAARPTAPELAEVEAEPARIIRRAIHPDAAQRYATARDFALACWGILRSGSSWPRGQLQAWLGELQARVNGPPGQGGLAPLFAGLPPSERDWSRGPRTALDACTELEVDSELFTEVPEPKGSATFFAGDEDFLEEVPPTELAPQPELPPAPARRIRLAQRLGRAGLGELVLAERQGATAAEQIVVKLLAPEHKRDSALVAELFAEASLLSRLHHPNVLRVIEFGTTDGWAYVVLPPYRGRSLAGLLAELGRQQRRLSYAEIAALGLGLLSGLQALATAVELHRLKPLGLERVLRPEEVLITPDGLPVLIGFALGSSAERRLLAGDLSFSEREAPKDLAALGGLLWSLTTGRPWPVALGPAHAVPSPTVIRGEPDGAFDRVVQAALTGPSTAQERRLTMDRLRHYLAHGTGTDPARILPRLLEELYGVGARRRGLLLGREVPPQAAPDSPISSAALEVFGPADADRGAPHPSRPPESAEPVLLLHRKPGRPPVRRSGRLAIAAIASALLLGSAHATTDRGAAPRPLPHRGGR